jgi:hypothetical protein
MDAETFMSGSQAIERGFADALLPADQVKTDDKTKARDRETSTTCAPWSCSWSPRAHALEARARINKIKGTPGAALDDDPTPGAGDTDWHDAFAAADCIPQSLKGHITMKNRSALAATSALPCRAPSLAAASAPTPLTPRP